MRDLDLLFFVHRVKHGSPSLSYPVFIIKFFSTFYFGDRITIPPETRAGFGTLPTISSPPYQAPDIRPPISGPLPYQAPISGPPYQAPYHIKPPISGPPYQTPYHMKPPNLPYQAPDILSSIRLHDTPYQAPTNHIKPLIFYRQYDFMTHHIRPRPTISSH